jgi:hydroxymethylglutaryl-CoA synthase
VALLVGPRAPLVLESQRVTFVKHAWDFYRPIGWHNNDALIDIDVATAQYEDALTWCQDQFTQAIGTRDLMSVFDFAAFHCNAPYHAKRNLRVMSEAMLGRSLTKKELNELYERHVKAGTGISAQNATTYTCPLYACILSFLVELDAGLVGKRILCFSYGSGCAASTYGLRVRGVPLYPHDVIDRLTKRVPKTVDGSLKLIQGFEDTYGKFEFEPSHVDDRHWVGSSLSATGCEHALGESTSVVGFSSF